MNLTKEFFVKKQSVLYLDTNGFRIFYVLLVTFRYRKDLNVIAPGDSLSVFEILRGNKDISTIVIDVSFFRYQKAIKEIEEDKNKKIITIYRGLDPLAQSVRDECKTRLSNWKEVLQHIPRVPIPKVPIL